MKFIFDLCDTTAEGKNQMTPLTRFLFKPRLNGLDALVIATITGLLVHGMPFLGVFPIVLVWAPVSMFGERKWGAAP